MIINLRSRTEVRVKHPVEVISDSIAALNKEDWQAFTDLCDPVSVRRFKRQLVEQFTEVGPRNSWTAEDFLSAFPDMPRSVAEYRAAEVERQRHPEERLKLEIRNVDSVEELKSLEPSEVLIRWLQTRSPHEFWAEVAESWKEKGENSWGCGESLSRYTILGSVRDGPEISHVVFRHDWADSVTIDQPEDWDTTIPSDERALSRLLEERSPHAVTCRKQGDGSWRIVADRNLFFLEMLSVGDAGEERD
jgi:hypothetical protein